MRTMARFVFVVAVIAVLYLMQLQQVAAQVQTQRDPATAPDAQALGRTFGPVTAVEIGAGYAFSCARFSNGGVKCWGANDNGQLGLGDTDYRGERAIQMGDNLPYVNLGTGRKAKKIAVGKFSVCAILDTNAVKCWGQNDFGQLGLGDMNNRGDEPNEMGDTLPIVNLGTGRTAKSISLGEGFACVILDTNAVKCWGLHANGQLGIGDGSSNNRGDAPDEMGNNLPTVRLGTGRTALTIGTGRDMVCVLLDNSTVKCWGRVVYGGELVGYGIGTFAYQMGDALQPIAFGIGKTVIKVFTGPESACVILNDATSKCWGGNISGILGNGNSNILGDALDEMGDSLPTLDFGSTTAVSFSNNGFESTTSTRCAILATHSIRCWGANDVGQLGIGDSVNHETIPNRLSDVQLGTGRTATSVAVGYNHVCALLDNATIKCWGYNISGELGYGDYLNRGDGPEEMGDALPAMSLGTELLPTATRTYTKSRTPTRTMTRTRTRTATKTNTPTKTKTSTKTRTFTKSRTRTKSMTRTRTYTATKSPTSTRTSTPTGTLTPTPTTIPTATETAVPTATPWFQT